MRRFGAEVYAAFNVKGARALSIPDLRAAGQLAKEAPAQRWRQVRGPLDALALSLARIGGAMATPFSLTTDLGVDDHLGWFEQGSQTLFAVDLRGRLGYGPKAFAR